MAGLLIRIRNDQRGVSAVIVAVCLVAFFGAAMITLDAGALWATRRGAITGSDAGALDAAYYFNTVAGGPCSPDNIAAAETSATNVLTRNNPNALHNATDTPNGFEVTTALTCGTSSYIPGKVRFDARAPSGQSFSHMFGFNNLTAFSSSTAAWGYIVALGQGLRPIALCDESSVTFPDPLPPAPAAPWYPQFHLWNEFWFGRIDMATYDSFFGSDALINTYPHYPLSSAGYENGPSNDNPNDGLPYVAPNGSNAFHTVHRLRMPDPDCGQSPGNRIWVDLTGTTGGTVGTSDLTDQIRHGYKGTVSLSPHDCNTGDEVAPPENCGARPGDASNPSEKALGDITCDTGIPAMSCPVVFPILVVDSVILNGSNAEYVQKAFLYVALRGFGRIITDAGVELDLEFVRVQGSGMIGAASPDPDTAAPTGIQLCGADNDGGGDRCPF